MTHMMKLSPISNIRHCVLAVAGIFCFPTMAQTGYQTLTERLATASTAPDAVTWGVKAEKEALRAEIIPSDPEVEFEYLWPGKGGEANRWSAGISQELPNFAKNAATRKVIAALDSLESLRREAALTDARLDAENRLLAIIAARKDAELIRQLSEGFDKLEQTYRKAWEKGEVSILDLNKIRIEQARAAASLEEAEGTLRALVDETVAVSRGALTAAELEGLTDYPARALQTIERYRELLACSPQIGVLDASSAVADLKLRLAGKERFPGLTLGYVHAFEEGSHFNGFSASLSLPVFSRNAVKATAHAELFSQTAENIAARASMEASLDSDYAKAQSLKRKLDRLGPVIDTTDNLRLLRVALDGGELSLLEYLQESNYFIEAIREYNAASYGYACALASLDRYSIR